MSRKQDGGWAQNPTAEFKVRSWHRCKAELCRRDSVTLWATDQVLTAWRAPPRTTPGGQGRYSSVVIEMMVMLRQVFHLALRETECLMESIMGILALDLPIPDHTTVSRRGAHLTSQHLDGLPDGPLHILLGKETLKVYGASQWRRDPHRHDLARTGRVVKIAVTPRNGTVIVAAGGSSETVGSLHGRTAPAQARSNPGRKDTGVQDARSASATIDTRPPRIARTMLATSPASGTTTAAASTLPISRRQSGPNLQTGRTEWKPGGGRIDQELVRTWLKPPVRGGGLIDRKRLTGLMSEVRRNTLTFIKAPAGYGKSTLLCQWYDALSSEDDAVGWFSAHSTENNLSKFFRYIVAAIRESRPGFSGRIGLMLDSIDTFSMEALSSAFINEALDTADDIFLFLDDFHLISDPAIAAAMSLLLGQAPANLHMIIASRQSLPFDLSRLRMRGLLAEIGADRLRFDQEDAANFLGLSGHQLSTAELETVVAKTEGWAAGIQLASILLTQRRSDFFSLISGEQKEITNFLAEDVMRHLPPETVEFMEKTSILARMNAALCAALTGNSDAQGQIDLLERKSLFLFSLDDKRNWYRYHHLFASFLQRRLLDRDPDLVSRLHSIASDWFAARGFYEEGVAHAIQAGDHVRAAGILERGCSNLLYAGRPSMLIEWSRSIPNALLQEYPRLQLEIAWSIILEWGFAEAGRLILDAEHKIEQLGTSHGQAWLDQMRQIVMHRKVMLYLFTDDMTNVEKEIMNGINTFPEDDPYLRGNLETNLLYARRELYRLNEVNQIDARAKDYYARSGSAFVLVWHELIAGPTWFLKGETGRADHSLRAAMNIAETIEGPGSALQAMPALLLAEIHYECNRCDQAAELIAKYGGEAEKKGFVDHLAAFYITRARLEMRAGAADAARATLALGRISADRHSFERLHRRIEHEELRQAIRFNDLSKARIIRDSGFNNEADLKPGPGTSSADETRILTWTRACCAMGDAAHAARILRLWIAFVREAGAVRSEVRFLIALAICLALSDREAEAARCLREAVGKAAGPRFVRCFLDEGEVVETLLQSLFRSGGNLTDPTSAFGRELLALFTREPNYAGLLDPNDAFRTDEANELAPPEVLNTREREVLAMAAAGLSNKEIARRLGLAEASIKWYMQQVFTKLDVRRRISAVRRAKQFGML